MDAFEEYMQASQELENSCVEYIKTLSEKEFLDELLSTLNDSETRTSMIIAVVRENIIQRQIGLQND